MKTLIELYDERPLENVLGVEMFRPERVVYICPEAGGPDERMEKKIEGYFRHRGLHPELSFRKVNIFSAQQVQTLLEKVVREYPECGLDITGGTDAVLFAAGLTCAKSQIPVVTYSRKKHAFYNIQNASFGVKLPCEIKYTVEDCFLMAGGSMRTGRVDNGILKNYMDDFDPFFQVYLENKRSWISSVSYMQKISPTNPDGTAALEVSGDYELKGERGSKLEAPEEVLRSFARIGFLRDLKIAKGGSVSFAFRDAQIRAWLRDVGSVLELYVYKACLDLGIFDDVRTSAIVEWDGDSRENTISNELDVMCTRGITPVFISCKTGDVRTEALNELAILKDRFGGEIAKAAIVTAEHGGTAMRNRAHELGIHVIDLADLEEGRIAEMLRHVTMGRYFGYRK